MLVVLAIVELSFAQQIVLWVSLGLCGASLKVLSKIYVKTHSSAEPFSGCSICAASSQHLTAPSGTGI